jgi:hypothetical protein
MRLAFLAMIRQVPTTPPAELELIRYLVQRAPATLRAASLVGQFPMKCAKAGGCDLSQRRPSGPDPPRRTHGFRPLHMVVAKTKPSVEMVRFFVAQDPGCVQDADADGSLPLHVALYKKGGTVDLELVRVLVEARPLTLLTADAAGSLPLHVALQQQGVDLEFVKYLVEQQPRALQRKNSGGLLPMHVAAAAAVSAAATGNNDAAAPPPPPDVVFYLASMWPQAVFGETGTGSVVGVVVGDDATSPRQRRPKRAKQS